MKQRRPTRARASSQPTWRRWLATFVLATVALIGSAEAAHVHGDWLPKSGHVWHATGHDGGQPGGEEHCPICVAMHSALPSTPTVAVFEAVAPVARTMPTAVSVEISRWHYPLFSRPPPPQV